MLADLLPAPTSATAERCGHDGHTFPGVRLFEIKGDCCGPDLRSRDMLMVAPVDRFYGEGVYLLDHGDGESPYACERHCGRPMMIIRHPNPLYETWEITPEQFQASVRAKVVAEVKMRDPELVRHLAIHKETGT